MVTDLRRPASDEAQLANRVSTCPSQQPPWRPDRAGRLLSTYASARALPAIHRQMPTKLPTPPIPARIGGCDPPLAHVARPYIRSATNAPVRTIQEPTATRRRTVPAAGRSSIIRPSFVFTRIPGIYVRLTLQMSRAPQRHDRTDGQARRLHLRVRPPSRLLPVSHPGLGESPPGPRPPAGGTPGGVRGDTRTSLRPMQSRSTHPPAGRAG